MKFNLATVIGTECKNSDIDHIWVLDADDSDYFYWNDSSLPKIHKMIDPQRLVIAGAADGLSNGYAGICVFPSASSLLESFNALHAINTSRIPLFVICFVDEPNTLPENRFSTLLGATDFFVRSVTEPSRVDSRIATSLQFAIAQKCVSVLLVNRSLSGDSRYDKCWRYKVHKTTPTTLPPDYAFQELASLINRVDRVSIFCGEQCKDCIAELTQLSQLIKSPVTYIPSIGKEIREKVAYEVGVYGKWCEQSAMEAIKESELILLFDYSEKDFDLFPVHPMIVQLTPFHLSGLDADKRKRIYRGDIKESLRKLLPLLEEKTDTSFVDKLVHQYKEQRSLLLEHAEKQNAPVMQLVSALDEQITRETVVCACGYTAYIVSNLLLKPNFKPGVDLPHPLLQQGGVIFEAVGLNGGSSRRPVIVLLDAGRLYDELSSLIPLTNLNYPVKVCILNKRDGKSKDMHSLSYSDIAKSMQIPYFTINEGLAVDRVVNDWFSAPGGSILEIFDVAFSPDYLVETEKREIPTFSVPFEKALYHTLTNLHAGKCFYCRESLDAKETHIAELNEFLHPLYTCQSAFYAAVGVSKTSGDIPVCIATSLSDVLQMLPGIWEARRTHTPVLFLVVLARRRDYFARKELKILHKVIHSVSAYDYLADNPEKDMGLILGQAIAEAQYLEGVSTIIFDPEMYESDDISSTEIFDSPYVESVVYPNKEELDKIADIINHSHNTVVFAGSGCRNAHKEVMELVRKLKAPLGWSFRSKDEFDYDNLYPIGMNGLLSNNGLDEAFRKCEVLLLLGSNLSFGNKIPKTCQIIQIDINPNNLGASHPVDMGVVGDIAVTLKMLLPSLLTIGHNNFAEKCSRRYEEELQLYAGEIELKANAQEGILAESIFFDINKYAPLNSWIVADMVLPWYLTALNIESKGERKIFTTGENIYTCNGTAFGVGVVAGKKENPLIIICTSFTFFNQVDNLITLMQQNPNVKIIILHLWSDTYKLNYSQIHLSSHVMGMVINTHEELTNKLMIGLAMQGPVVIDIPVLRKELIKSPQFLPAMAQRYSLILHKLYHDSEKEEMLHTSGRMEHFPESEA